MKATLSTTRRGCVYCFGGVEQVLAAFAADAVVCCYRSRCEVGDEVHDDLRPHALCEADETFLVEDVADHGFHAHFVQLLTSLGRAGETDDVVCVEVRERCAAKNAGCACEEDAQGSGTSGCRVGAAQCRRGKPCLMMGATAASLWWASRAA